MMRVGLLLLLLSAFSIVVSQCEEQAEYKDINDLFISFNDSTDPSEQNVEMLTFDIAQIDINRAKKNLEMELKDKLNEEDKEIPQSGRRGVVFYDSTPNLYKDGIHTIVKEKALQATLQLIYMARHQMRQMESSQHYDLKNVGFRIGFLFKKMRALYMKLGIITAQMENEKENTWYDLTVTKHIQLHNQCVKLHVDFQYYYWVLIQLDGKFKDTKGYQRTLPIKSKYSGGISMEYDTVQNQNIGSKPSGGSGEDAGNFDDWRPREPASNEVHEREPPNSEPPTFKPPFGQHVPNRP